MDNRRRMLLSGGLSADPVLENNDWATISEISRAGKAEEFWNIGDKKNITVDGKTYAMRIIGFDHDDVTDPAAYGRAKAGITFEVAELFNYVKMNSSGKNTGGWGSATLRNSSLYTVYNYNLDSELKSVIVPVNKQYIGTYSSSALSTISDKLFILSEAEYLGKASRGITTEGSQYAYYAAGNSTLKKYNGNYAIYWMRTPYYGSEYYFAVLRNTSSGSTSTEYADNTRYYAPAFCV